MKKKLKAFTLVELIIVMLIFTIIMGAIVRMFEPISSVYSNSSVQASQRSAEQGIATYITENIRNCQSIGVYQKQASADAAMTAFLANNPTDLAGNPLTKNDLEVICINNTGTYTVDGTPASTGQKTFKGRILRKKVGQSNFTESQPFNYTGAGSAYMAMGDAYYGPADYYIRIENFSSAGLEVVIDSDYYYNAGKTKMLNRADNYDNYTRAAVVFNNTNISSDSVARVVDDTQIDATVGTRMNQTKNTYIVFYNG